MVLSSLLTSQHSNALAITNESYLNLKLANQSFSVNSEDSHTLAKRRLSDSRSGRASFSWQHTWKSDSSRVSRSSLKTCYYKGKMYTLPENLPAQHEIIKKPTRQPHSHLDSALLAIASFSACSFVTFIFAICQRMAG